jgi:SAM-dependent methyltransferase
MIDERAARGFATAERYDAYRPSYPAAAVTYIRETARLDERSTVVDLGAGTGLMTRLLAPVGRLIAVEPVPEMRGTLQARVPEAQVIDGAAEAIPLPSASTDAIVVAQAFHWFANREALAEIARVLKPHGALFLVWNVKDPQDSGAERLDAVLAPYRLASPGFASTPWQDPFQVKDAPLRLTVHRSFGFEETLTLAALKGRVLSASYIALLEQPAQATVLEQLELLVGSSADGAVVVMRYRTEVFTARRP